MGIELVRIFSEEARPEGPNGDTWGLARVSVWKQKEANLLLPDALLVRTELYGYDHNDDDVAPPWSDQMNRFYVESEHAPTQAQRLRCAIRIADAFFEQARKIARGEPPAAAPSAEVSP